VREARVLDGKILLDLDDPTATNPDIVAAATAAGARVQYLTELKYGLEELYMKLMEGAS
jgi:hypothetical protein